ncbi:MULTISPECIES: hypothetical protein [Paenarthrobacter]|jgi:hypothetical protein|uniref:hypothetical protein n=1 Tax=Paenarthrobacter TaxID=1742992 RepID=UPI0009D3900E|nr:MULTISPECIES: hypothetical protein [Paenarthrobacter]SKC01158.1 hypothetical protein SAMN05660916_03870 [Arthrobacter sp. 31Cvi3.1E]BCW12778.1 hypothetical protein NtRootA2_40600 [Arthrobacter sp. NtRootA2]BCW16860.1 hypothetical protein NtRootA4_38390 [Arthrobacter sp. NtRootA4]BCW25193.1 hypothetical protein NtRootC7_40600 [Arthrobacter sp. NtRootC7]BCW29461.1 hypothetical protein NtRootC45_40610 [Arthrobacter sp. NtRootC45]BCW33734.1 hypothetical protein NtRootD5_40650 [Arthrobacter sp.
MDATPLNNLVLTVVFAAIALYALYFVVRAGVRDGILQAKKISQDSTSREQP